MRKFIVFVIVTLYISTGAMGQLGIKIGAAAAYVENEKNLSVLDRYNESHPDMSDGFGSMNFIYGLQGGLRYRIGDVAWDITYQNMNSSVVASGNYDTNDFVEKSLYYNFNRFDIGLEYIIKKVGIGANIGYNFMNIKSNTNTSSEKQRVLSDYVLDSQFFVSINLAQTDVMALVLRPYVSVSWDGYELGNLDKFLNPDSTIPSNQVTDKFNMIGMSFVIYNGEQ